MADFAVRRQHRRGANLLALAVRHRTGSIENSVNIYRSGTYPIPGALAQQFVGPVLTDGVLNEYRYLDENNTIPLVVPVVQAETFVLSLAFAEAPDPTQGPSVVNDSDGIEPNRNAIYAFIGGDLSVVSEHDTRRHWRLGHPRGRRLPGHRRRSRRGVTMSADPTEYIGRRGIDLHDHGRQRRARRIAGDDDRRRVSGRVYGRDMDMRRIRRRELHCDGSGSIADGFREPSGWIARSSTRSTASSRPARRVR